MKLKSILFILLFLTGAIGAFAQTSIPGLSTVIPPSPNVLAMQKYGDIPVSTYTGVPDINIPLYTIKSHDITIPISISYHASGIKVGEEASSVGLGWVLNAGGSISRKIIGYDDFQTNVYFTYPSGVYDLTNAYQPDANIMNNGSIYNQGQTNQLSLANDIYGTSPLLDFEPDQFYFNLPGGTNGKFILKRNFQAVLQKQEKIDISCLSNDGSNWEVKSVDGYTYDFTQIEYYNDPNNSPAINHITTVYLTKITSPTGQTVIYNYTPNNISHNYVNPPGSYSESYDIGGPPQPTGYIMQQFPQIQTQGRGEQYTCYSISSIDYDSGQIQFNYTSTRTDVPGDNQLNSITVFTKDNQGNLSSSPIKTFAFAYDYFTPTNAGNTYTPVNNSSANYINRLRLNSVTESGNYNGQPVTANPYIFTYYTSATPGYNSLALKNSFARDHWGYYNGNILNTSLVPKFTSVGSGYLYYEGIMGPQREANGQYMTAFTLSDIQYPTGGTTHFDYEANDCDEQKSEINDYAGYHYNFTLLTSPNVPPSGGMSWVVGQTSPIPILDMSDEFDDPTIGILSTPVTVTFRTNTIPQGVSINTVGAAYMSVVNTANNLEVARFDPALDYATIQQNSAVITDTKTIALPPGKYQIVPHVDGSSSNYSYYIVGISFLPTPWLTMVNSNPAPGITNPVTYSPAGGLRIKRITDNDGIHSPKIKRYIYHYTVNNIDYSYGRRMSKPRYVYWQQSENEFVITVGGLKSYWLFYPDHTMQVSDSAIPLDGSGNGVIVGYDQVTVNNGENGEDGYTVYKYHNNPDIIAPYFSNYYSVAINLPRYRPYNSNISDPLNGLLLERTDYKSGGIPVRDEINTYTTAQENDIYAILPRSWPKFEADFNGSPPSVVVDPLTGNWNIDFPTNSYTVQGVTYGPANAGDLTLYTYRTLQSIWTYKTLTDVKLYSFSDATKYQETITDYYYDNPYHYLPTRIVVNNSKGEVVTTHISYPLDFACSSPPDPTNFSCLNPSEPISLGIETLLKKHLYDAPVEKYVQITEANGSNSRVVSGIINGYGTTLPLLNTVYELQTATPITSFQPLAISSASTTKNGAYQPLISFDSYDLTGNLLQQHKNLDISHSYQWAYNKNYPIAECKNAATNEFYFQGFEDDASDPGLTTAYHHTGNYASTTSSVSWPNPNNGRIYYITYWYYNSSISKWVYMPQQTYSTSTFNLAQPNAVAYDDIRIFPSDAQMTTYTYDTLVGMTSSTDAKEMTTYYEYDGLQRLMNVKDKDGNIIKNYKYHYEPQVQ